MLDADSHTSIIMDIGTIIPAATGIGTATITIGTIPVIMTGMAAVIMVTTTMIDAASAYLPTIVWRHGRRWRFGLTSAGGGGRPQPSTPSGDPSLLGRLSIAWWLVAQRST